MGYIGKCPKCGYELKEDEIHEKPIGRKTRIAVGIFVWLCALIFTATIYINWHIYLAKYDAISFAFNLIMSICLIFVMGWMGYGLILNKKPFAIKDK